MHLIKARELDLIQKRVEVRGRESRGGVRMEGEWVIPA